MGENLGDLINEAFEITNQLPLDMTIYYDNDLDSVKFIFEYSCHVNSIMFSMTEINCIGDIRYLTNRLHECVYTLLDGRFDNQ